MVAAQTIESLIWSLRHPEKRVVRQAADTLIAMAPSAPELGSILGRLLRSTPEKDRWPIAYVLAQITAPSDACMEVLLKGLGSDDPDIRWAATGLLARLGKSQQRIVADLCKLLKSGTPTQRRMAVYCIRDNDQRQVCQEALLDSLHDPDPLVRVASVTSLKAYSTIAKAGLDSLLRLFREDPDSRVRHSAAFTLGRLGASDGNVRLALSEACRSPDPKLQKVARAALSVRQKKGPAGGG